MRIHIKSPFIRWLTFLAYFLTPALCLADWRTFYFEIEGPESGILWEGNRTAQIDSQGGVRFRGRFQRSQKNLISNKNATAAESISIAEQAVKMDANGSFDILIPNLRKSFERGDPISVKIIDSTGHIQASQLRAITSASIIPSHPFELSVGAGYFAYEGTALSNSSSFTPSVKGNYQIGFKSLWSLSAAVLMNTSGVPETTTGHSARFVGANLQAGYGLPIVDSVWQLIVVGGVDYITLLGTQNAFGFQNIFYPNIFPVLQRPLSSGAKASVYAKYTPLGSGWLASSDNQEFSAGAAYQWKLTSGRPVSLNFDFSQYSFAEPQVYFSMSLLRLSLGVGL